MFTSASPPIIQQPFHPIFHVNTHDIVPTFRHVKATPYILWSVNTLHISFVSLLNYTTSKPDRINISSDS